MRISDWSSDVCSSDLRRPSDHVLRRASSRRVRRLQRVAYRRMSGSSLTRNVSPLPRNPPCARHRPERMQRPGTYLPDRLLRRGAELRRSEEHTSELQSLMRISYAVFCLKKQKIESL